jgi:5-(carboxyamino)imidazole ribonucleotide synthase
MCVIIGRMIRLGILGGGQLAQMLTQAAISLGVETAIFAQKSDSPASRLTQHNVVGAWEDQTLLRQFADLCDVVTLENEFVDAGVLERLEALGTPVYPGAATLATVQDKLKQKLAMQAAGLLLPQFEGVDTPAEAIAAGEQFGWPVVLKARREGYDGYGNVTLQSADEVPAAWAQLGADEGRTLLVEAWVPFVRELAVMVLRGRDGDVLTYPLVETVQRDHICHVVRAPAAVNDVVVRSALNTAIQAVTTLDGVGVFGVELFELEDGSVLYNEVAPRPHNSGHYTIEGCRTSQFENHIRAVLGWSFGTVDMVKPAAVMVNVLGTYQGDAPGDAGVPALALPDAHLHLYAKRDVRVGRKMGHVTVLSDSIEGAETIAREAVESVRL